MDPPVSLWELFPHDVEPGDLAGLSSEGQRNFAAATVTHAFGRARPLLPKTITERTLTMGDAVIAVVWQNGWSKAGRALSRVRQDAAELIDVDAHDGPPPREYNVAGWPQMCIAFGHLLDAFGETRTAEAACGAAGNAFLSMTELFDALLRKSHAGKKGVLLRTYVERELQFQHACLEAARAKQFITHDQVMADFG